jgi:signal peptidase I
VTDYKKILQRNYVKTALGIGLVIAIVLGFFFGLVVALGTAVPVRVVESGSMCTSPVGCDGWSDVFNRTLHRGDIILIQAVMPEEINANYPNSDIIVYQSPENPLATPIVHRVVAKYQVNGTWYFQTKGDGNGNHWPAPVTSSDYDSNQIWFTGEGVSQNLVLGRVVLRFPHLGWITLIMQNNNWVLSLVIALIIALIVIEFVLPVILAQRKKKKL